MHARRHYFIHDIVVRCKKSSDAPITTKDNTLLNLFSVSCKCDHVWRWFRSSLLVLSHLTIAVVIFFVWQRRQVCVQISNWSLYYIDSGTQHHNKIIILSFLCSWIWAVFNWPPPAFTLYCLQLALWCNCDIKNARKCMKFPHWQTFMCTLCLIVLKLDWGYS